MLRVVALFAILLVCIPNVAFSEISPQRDAQLQSQAGTYASRVSGWNNKNTETPADDDYNLWGDYREDSGGYWFGVGGNYSQYATIVRDLLIQSNLAVAGDLEDESEVRRALVSIPENRRQVIEAAAQEKTRAAHSSHYTAKLDELRLKEENPVNEVYVSRKDGGSYDRAGYEEQNKKNRAAVAAAEAKTAELTKQPEEIYCLDIWKSPMISFSGCVAHLAYIFLGFTSWVLWAAAIFFNYTLDYTLNIAGFIEKTQIVSLGWATFRDFANLFFVFMVLYIAINTILGNSGYGIKALLGKVIVAAILINFSLFFTKVIVDTSNIFALQFYSKIQQKSGGVGDGDLDGGISAALASSMGLHTVWGIGKASQNTAGSAIVSSDTELGLNSSNLIIAGFGGGIFIIITSIVFFAGGLMLLVRTLTLVFLMILSPFAFIGGILPATKSHASKWWSSLFSNAIFAPVYMAMLYLVLSMVLDESKVRVRGGSFLQMFAGETAFVETFVTFIVLNGLMIGCLVIAQKLGAVGSSVALSYAKGTAGALAGGIAFGATAKVARGVVGRGVGGAIQEATKKSTSRTGLMLNRLGRGLGNASFDARNVNGVGKKLGIGTGEGGGYKQRLEAKNKKLTERYTADYEALDDKGQGKQSLVNRLQQTKAKGTKKIGDDLAKKNIEEETKKQRDILRDFKDNSDYQDFLKLVNKSKSDAGLSDAELKKAQDLQKTLSSLTIDRKTWDPTVGEWKEAKEEKMLDIGKIEKKGIEVNVDHVKNLADHASAADKHVRTKKHTAKEKYPKP